MSTQLSYVLIRLSQDPFLSEKFKDDPARVIAPFNLSAAEAALLEIGDNTAIDEALKIEAQSPGKVKPKKKKTAPKK